MVKKVYILIFAFLFTLTPIVYRPFIIYGESSLFTEPFSGYNINIVDYAIDSDRVYTLSSNSSSGTFQTTSGSAISMGEGTMSNGKTYYSTGLAGGGVSLQGSISLSMSNSLSSSVTNQVRRVIEIEIILNNFYCGNASVTLKNGSTTLKEEIVQFNGTSSRFTYIDTSLNMTNADNYTISIGTFYLVESVNRQYNFPIESFNFVDTLFQYGNELIGFDEYNSYSYPIFTLESNTPIFRRYLYTGEIVKLVFFVNSTLNTNNVLQFFSFSSANYSDLTVQSIARSTGVNNSNWQGIYQLTFTCTNTSTQQIKVINQVQKFIPIYANTVGNANGMYELPLSTDFALQYGLSNRLLNNLDIIANGTNNSNNSSSNLNDSNEELTTAIDSFDTLENNAVNNMDSALNSIDMTNTPTAMGSKFQASAIWVKQQFDRMTNNTPIGSLLGFSLILGISLLIIGRVLK